MANNTSSGQFMNRGASTSDAWQRQQMLPTLRIHIDRIAQNLRNGTGTNQCYRTDIPLIAESRYLEFKLATSRDLQTKEGQDEIPIERYVVAFLNAEGGTLLLGVAATCYVVGVYMPDNKSEKEFLRVFEDTMGKIKPPVSRDMYFVNMASVNGKWNKKVIEISVAKAPEKYYETHRGEIYIRREGSVQGPLQGPKRDDFLRQRSETSSSNMKMRQDVDQLKAESEQTEQEVIKIKEGAEEITEKVREATENLKKINGEVGGLRAKLVDIEHKDLPKMAGNEQKLVTELLTSVQLMEEDITGRLQNEAQERETTQTNISNTQEDVNKQKEITDGLEERMEQLKSTKKVDSLRKMVEANHEKAKGWHVGDEKAMGLLAQKAGDLKTAQEEESKKDRIETKGLLDSAEKDSTAIKQLGKQVEELDKKQQKLEAKTTKVKEVVEAKKKKADECHQKDKETIVSLKRSILRLIQVQNRLRRQNDDEVESSASFFNGL